MIDGNDIVEKMAHLDKHIIGNQKEINYYLNNN